MTRPSWFLALAASLTMLMATSSSAQTTTPEATTFPLIMKMDSASINAKVATLVWSLAFPEHTEIVKAVAQWAATVKGLDVHATLTVAGDSLTFSPNDFMDWLGLTGLKTVQVPAASVTDIYEVTSRTNGFTHLVLTTKRSEERRVGKECRSR